MLFSPGTLYIYPGKLYHWLPQKTKINPWKILQDFKNSQNLLLIKGFKRDKKLSKFTSNKL